MLSQVNVNDIRVPSLDRHPAQSSADERPVSLDYVAARSKIIVPYSSHEIEEFQLSFSNHEFLRKFSEGTFETSFARKVAATQVGYNLYFISSLTAMRTNFGAYPEFVLGFLDSHLASELGGNIEHVGLVQDGETHIAMIYRLVETLGMSPKEAMNWGSSADTFFRDALTLTIGGQHQGEALGALYADEVLAASWFPKLREGFKNFAKNSGVEVDCTFFDIHADDVEPAHVAHATRLVEFSNHNGFGDDAFRRGFVTFRKKITTWFDSMLEEMC